MDQHIGFCGVDGGRIAYATTGEGPPLVFPAWWVSHLEVDWQGESFRAFVEALSAHHKVIRYDRLGSGLSDRDRRPDLLTIDAEVEALERLFDELALDRAALLSISCGGCIGARFAARNPERVSALAFFGSYADGSRVAPDTIERLMIAAVRTHWGVGSRMLADVFYADAPEAERVAFERFQRAASTPEMAAELLELVYSADVREDLPALDVPTLVMHRRRDRGVPFELGRELAAMVPGARLVPLEGRTHVPWSGQSGAVIELVLRFLSTVDAPATADANGADGVLSDRETEVLRLVAGGLNDVQIAEALVLSPHTVHRHVANIRTKLRQPTRGAAAAEAARRGLI